MVFLFSIASGPAQLVQLTETLRKVFGNSERTSEKRSSTNLRYLKTGDIGETRVGVFRSYLKGKYIKQLADQGIEFTNKTPLGRPGISIDTSNPSQEKFRGLSDKDVRAAAGLPDDPDIKVGRQDNRIFFDFDYQKADGHRYGHIAASNITKNTGVGKYFDGKIGSSIKFRAILGPYFGLKGLLSPKLVAVKGEQYAGKANARAAEEKRASPRAEKTKAVTAGVRERLKGRLDGKTAALKGALITQTASCLVYESAADAVEFNHKAIVVASAMEAADKIAVGENAKAGNLPGAPIDLGRAGAVAQTFEDEDGKTIWQSAGIQALATNGKDATGEEIPPEYQQAFSSETTADNVQKNTQKKVGPIDATKIVCGPIGITASIAASIALIVAGPITFGGSWGVFAAKTSASAAASYGVMALLRNQLVKLLSTDLLVKPPLSGPLGGNLLAYGARASANMSAVSSGGIALSNTQAVTFLNEQEEHDQQEFKSKSFFARLFDVYDYRSLTAQTVNKIGPSPANNLANFSGGLSNFGGAFSSLFSTLIPSVSAQDAEAYVWGFPIYGIPDEVADDPALADPNENDKIISELLDRDEGKEYIERAKKCFGVNINKDSGQWAAPITEDVNPASKDYTDGDCGNLSKTNWKRLMLFIFDTHLMTSLACYEDNKEACAELSVASGDTQADNSGGSGQVVDGSVKELAQKLLDYKDQGKYNCDNAGDCGDLELMAEGKSIDCSKSKSPACHADNACHVDALDKRVMQLIIYLIDSDYKIGTYSLCRAHSKTKGVHDDGLGLDISSINGKSLGSDKSSRQLALEVNKLIFELKGDLEAQQIISAGVGNTNKVDLDFVKYNRQAPGKEGAAAVAFFGSDTMNGHDDHIHVGY